MVSVTASLFNTDLGMPRQPSTRRLQSWKAAGQGHRRPAGQVEPLNQTLAGLKTGLGVAILAILLMLAATFQSLRLSFAVIAVIPAALCGVALALWLTGTTLNIQSFTGAIMAMGVAVSNAILFVTFAERERANADASAAAVEGGRSRLRPILMTSLAMIAACCPSPRDWGPPRKVAPLGRAVVGGLALATVATLLVLPAIFSLLSSRSVRTVFAIDR